MKKLNNKGFTLIELLAVVVILAIVMGIAGNSVLNSMNTSRKGSLENNAVAVANSFTNEVATNLVMGINKAFGLDFTTANVYKLSSLKDDAVSILKLNPKDFNLEQSYVKYNGEVFTVCLAANENGKFYVSSAVKSTSPLADENETTQVMWACSDNSNSWTS